jgi:hypothetical protein
MLEPLEPALRERLGNIERWFLDAYFGSVRDPAPAALAALLDRAPPEFRGFAYEGAGMGLAMVDAVTPWRKTSWSRFLEGPGARFAALMYVGRGWAIARLGLNLHRALADLHPLLGWLTVDGYGFHHGFFDPHRYLIERAIRPELPPFYRRIFDQGLGRSLWFGAGANVQRLAAIVGAFEPARQADIWAGVGLASAYAGGRDVAELEHLVEAAGPARAEMARGASLAVLMRQVAGEPVAHTGRTCAYLTGLPVESVIGPVVTALDRHLELSRPPGGGPDAALYERFLAEVRDGLANAASLVRASSVQM